MLTGLRLRLVTRPSHLALPGMTSAITLAMVALAGCGASSYSSSSGPANPTGVAGKVPPGAVTPGFSGLSSLQGTHDAVTATSTPADQVTVVTEASRTVSIIFNSDDGRLITGFGISGSPGMLPPGWTGPANFSCDAISVGSSCILNLTYAPTAVENGTLTFNYVYLDDATEPKTGDSFTLRYQSTHINNVVGTIAPTGQVNAVSNGASQPVTVNFTSDNGRSATLFTLSTDLSSLPAGWTSAMPGLSCAIVSTGNGCQLTLHYVPSVAASGTFSLSYAYRDEAGAPKTGVVNIPYATTAANNVVATASPSGQILAVQQTGGRSVAIAFTTDNGKPAHQLFVTTNLQKLPDGWSSASSTFGCSSVNGGNGCQLLLNYAPRLLASGTLSLRYAYVDDAGARRAGLLNIDYAATTNDNVTGTASPAGSITAVVSDGSQPGTGTQAVTVTFATDDGRPATALQVTSDLSALPSGWTGPAAPFGCAGINPDSQCVLPLSYTPTAAGAGAVVLTYRYLNNAGESKSGSVNLAYRATENDNVQWTASMVPSWVRTGSVNPVNITFQTDDGNPASALVLTSSLASLPAGWTSQATTFNCASVSAGTVCTLPLTYAPTQASIGGTLALGYSYVNDAGYPATGTVTITYGAFTPHL